MAENRKILPNLEVWRSINGYNVNETMAAFASAVDEGVKYHWLQFETFGTLAIWLTKRAALQTQVTEREREREGEGEGGEGERERESERERSVCDDEEQP